MFQITDGTMNIGHVVLLGVGTVFVGLICIIVLCMLMGKVVPLLERKREGAAPQNASASQTPMVASAAPAIPNRPELVAAIACALAEELGTDVSAIRICSLKKV